MGCEQTCGIPVELSSRQPAIPRGRASGMSRSVSTHPVALRRAHMIAMTDRLHATCNRYVRPWRKSANKRTLVMAASGKPSSGSSKPAPAPEKGTGTVNANAKEQGPPASARNAAQLDRVMASFAVLCEAGGGDDDEEEEMEGEEGEDWVWWRAQTAADDAQQVDGDAET